MKLFSLVIIAVGTLIGDSLGARGTYNYGEAVEKSLLFYESQRSGELPSTNRISWRRSSFTNDRDGRFDLSGGYFDAGDYVKFNFPMAYTMTTLAMGGIEFPRGYNMSGQTENLYDAIKWGLDYLLKCHVAKDALYVHVGNASADHVSWDLPERWTESRPAYKITDKAPGSDVAGETAAAMAAGSILLRKWNSTYSKTLLTHAKTIYNFAKNHRGFYGDSVKAATPYYLSQDYLDELAWAAAWLHRATGYKSYLNESETFYAEANGQWLNGFHWGNKFSGVDILLARATGKQLYKDKLKNHCNHSISEAEKGPKGLLVETNWGSLRAASNNVFICLNAAKLNIDQKTNRNFARKQIDLMLGEYGRSFVVGMGKNPPVKAHHRSSSCPDPPASCGWSFFRSNATNANMVVGALVGGPDKNGTYEDIRNDAVRNEVALDYNAAFQGACAGLAEVFGQS